jgi:type IV pilus assembly protein PilY1
MNNKNYKSRVRRALASTLAALTAFSPMGSLSYAAVTPLADTPVSLATPPKPNIMFTLDNSGSMRATSMPDGIDLARLNFRNDLCNRIYYNPAIFYTPPVKADGTLFPSAKFDATPYDGFDSAKGTIDLRTEFRVDLGSDRPNVLGTGELANYAKHLDPQPAGGTCDSDTQYEVVPLDSAHAPFPKAPSRANCAGATCTLNEERQNFANWFSYYRTRILVAKTAVGRAVVTLDDASRVGFNTISKLDTGVPNDEVTDGTWWLNIRDFDAAQKNAWFDKLYGRNDSHWTPLRTAMDKIGKLYSGTLTGAQDPVQASCQRNYHILSTDGYWNDDFSGVGDLDSTDAGYSTRAAGVFDATATPDTLADVALKYYMNDLRGGMNNNVLPIGKDKATHQHMTTFTVGMGASGTKPYREDYEEAANPADPAYEPNSFFAKLLAGTEDWPVPQKDQATAIDDLWHAAVAGRGKYLSAQNAEELATSMQKILGEITGSGSAAGSTLASPVITATNNAVYSVGYDASGWYGKLTARRIDPATGAVGTELWTDPAEQKLDARVAGTGWDTGRKIATFDGDDGVPFRLGALKNAQRSTLGATSSEQQDVLNFLRGQRGNEGTLFRKREKVLGDIVGSEAVAVGKPSAVFSDVRNKGYSKFKADFGSRAKTVYVGANDGMLHAFDAVSGEERWAYAPSMLLRDGADGLAALSYKKDSSTKRFTHHFYVDATPVVADVDFDVAGSASGSGTPNWRTILIGGLNKGGRGFYALDVTDSDAADENAVAAKVLWEFTDQTKPEDMGYSFGKPLVAKTRAYGWVVLVSSGYNNASGNGFLYVLNPKTGAILKKLATGAGTASDPSGFAQFSGYTLDFSDYTVEQVYGGDLLGNLWRFDLSGSNANSWSTVKFGSFSDSSGNAQPVTTAPSIEIDPQDDKTRWVFVGTGRMLDKSDISSNQTQTMYGLKDGTTTTVEPAASGQSLPLVRNALTNAGTANPQKGWYKDLNSKPGERVVVDAAAFEGVVSWVSAIPSTDPCAQPVTGKAYAKTFDATDNILVDGTGTAVESLASATGYVAIQIVKVGGVVRIVGTTGDAINNAGAPEGVGAVGKGGALSGICSGNCTNAPSGIVRTSVREVIVEKS